MLVKQTLLYLPAQVLAPIFQFVSMIAWTHVLSPEEMGVFALVTAAQELIYVATLSWFSLYTVRYYDPAAESTVRTRFLATESGVSLTASVVAALLGAVALPVAIGAAWPPALLSATVLYCVSRGHLVQLSERARASHDILSYSVLQIGGPVLGLPAAYLLTLMLGARADVVLLGYALVQTASILVVLPRLRAALRGFQGATVRAALQYGMPLVMSGALIWVAANGVRFLVEHAEGAAAVGLLTVGWGLGQRGANFAAMAVTAAAFPLAVRRSREAGFLEGQAQLATNGLLLLATLAPVAIALWDMSDPLVRLLVAPAFQQVTADVLPCAIIAGALRNMRVHSVGQVFLLKEVPSATLYADAVDGVLTLVLGAIGLALYGLTGVVVGAAIASAVALIAALAVARVRYGFALPVPDVARILVAGSVMYAVLAALPITPSFASLAAATGLGGSTYLVMLALLYPRIAAEAVHLLRRVLAPHRA